MAVDLDLGRYNLT